MPTAFTPSRRVGFRATSAACLLLLASTAAPGAPPAATAPTAAIDALLKGSFPADRPGAAVIVVKDGRTLFRKAYGMANLELGVPLQPDMVFRLGSVTKQFTAVAILMLAEEGKLSAGPDHEVPPGYPTQGHMITVEHLLTHTSGIQSYTEMPGWMAPQGPITLTELIDGFKNEPMEFAPDEKWLYNNSGYVLLGAIIEKASGQTYEEFVRANLQAARDDALVLRPHRATSRDGCRGYTGRATPRNARYLSMTQPYAAGSLASTVDDLARWDATLYTKKLVKQASLEKAWKPYVLTDGKTTGYGYGWGVSSCAATHHRARRRASSASPLTRCGAGRHVYVAVLCNSDSPSADPGYLAKKIAALVIGDPFPEPAADRPRSENPRALRGGLPDRRDLDADRDS